MPLNLAVVNSPKVHINMKKGNKFACSRRLTVSVGNISIPT